MGDARVAPDPIMAAFGVSAVVTRPAPDATPITTTVVWHPTQTEDVPVGNEFARREPRRVLAVRRDEVPTMPRGTLVVCAEESGGASETWRVDALDRYESDLIRVVVVPHA